MRLSLKNRCMNIIIRKAPPLSKKDVKAKCWTYECEQTSLPASKLSQFKTDLLSHWQGGWSVELMAIAKKLPWSHPQNPSLAPLDLVEHGLQVITQPWLVLLNVQPLSKKRPLLCERSQVSVQKEGIEERRDLYFLTQLHRQEAARRKRGKHCKPIKVEPRQGHDDVRTGYKEKGKFYILESHKDI